MTRNLLLITLSVFMTSVLSGQATTEADLFIKLTGANNYDGLIYREGSYSGRFVVNQNSTYVDPTWGGHWYGIDRIDPLKIFFNKVRSSSFRYPVSLNGFYGIGFRTANGKMAFLQNGILALALTDAKLVQLSDNESTNPFKLYVGGGIQTESIVTDPPSLWADYVFDANYDLLSIAELRSYITINGHLPDVPSEIEIQDNGVNLAEMDAALLRKVEELTLYIIDLKKRIDLLKFKTVDSHE